MVKQVSQDLKTFDIKYHATMTKNKVVSLRHKEGKETTEHLVCWENVFVVFLALFTN